MGCRHHFAQNLHSFGHQFGGDEVDSSGIAARAIEAGDEPCLDWVTGRSEYDRDRRGRSLSRECAGPAARYSDHPHPAVHEVGRQFGKSAVLTFRPAEFQRHVLSFLITLLGEAFAKSGYLLATLRGRAEIEEPHHWHHRLLR